MAVACSPDGGYLSGHGGYLSGHGGRLSGPRRAAAVRIGNLAQRAANSTGRVGAF